MSAQKIRNSIMAVAVAGLLAAATACSSSESRPPQDLTPESLLAYLSDHDMPFTHAGYQSPMPFRSMNGFERRAGVTGEFTWEAEKLWIHEFVGPGEALVAATRIRPDGSGYMMPTRSGGWVGGGGYGTPGPVRYYLNGKIIAVHLGDSPEVPKALEKLMGEPFAGAYEGGTEADLEERIPAAEGMWQEITPEAEFLSYEKFGEGSSGITYRILYRANLTRSFACSGESDFLNEVSGDEIHVNLVQRIVDTSVVPLTEPCDIRLEWIETSAIVQRLTSGKTYKVSMNGEQVATFTAS